MPGGLPLTVNVRVSPIHSERVSNYEARAP
jgi:hypothetical protein